MILISDKNAMLAAEWCQNNLSKDSWQITTRWPNPGVIFKISDHQMEMIFRLKWI